MAIDVRASDVCSRAQLQSLCLSLSSSPLPSFPSLPLFCLLPDFPASHVSFCPAASNQCSIFVRMQKTIPLIDNI